MLKIHVSARGVEHVFNVPPLLLGIVRLHTVHRCSGNPAVGSLLSYRLQYFCTHCPESNAWHTPAGGGRNYWSA